MATYHRPHQDASSSSSAGSSYLPLPRQGEPTSSQAGGYTTSNIGASGSGGGGPSYSSGQFNNYPSSHSQQQRPPHLPPPLQHQQQSSYSSLPSHPPHQHPTYHHPHAQRPTPTQPSSSMSYANFDYPQPLPVFPHGYPSFRQDASGRGQPSNGANGGGSGGQVSRHPNHSSTGSAGRSEDFKPPTYPFFGSTSSATGQPIMDGSGAQRNGVQDEWNPVNVPPLPSHVEANIFAGNAPWPFSSVELDQAADRNGGGPIVAESASGSEHKQPSDAGQPTSSPPIPTQTIAKLTPSAQNNADPSPANSQLNLPDIVDFGFTPSTTTAMYDPLPVALPSQMAPPTDPLLIGQPQEGWSLVVEPDTFLSGLEGISALPLNKYHAAATLTTGMPDSLADLRRAGNLTYEDEMDVLATYLGEIIRYLEPFAATRDNPTPTHPPPFLHTRILRLAVIVRNSIRDLEKSSQPCLDATFRHAPPGVEQTEADKEMAAIRDRRQELMKKQDVKLKQTNNNGMPSSVGPNRLPPPRPGVNMGSGPPRPYIHAGPRDVYRCAGCNTTQSLEWLTGPDGSQSLCHSCGHRYEVLNHARQGDPDFSTIPVPGHNSNLVGLRPN